MGVVNEMMKFETYNDFYVRRYIIKNLFDKLDYDNREIYKYYLYSNRLLSVVKVDRIWEFLVSIDNEEFVITEYKLKKFYNKKGDCNGK